MGMIVGVMVALLLTIGVLVVLVLKKPTESFTEPAANMPTQQTTPQTQQPQPATTVTTIPTPQTQPPPVAVQNTEPAPAAAPVPVVVAPTPVAAPVEAAPKPAAAPQKNTAAIKPTPHKEVKAPTPAAVVNDFGFLSVKANGVKTAIVYLDGAKIGYSPVVFYKTKTGKHTIVFEEIVDGQPVRTKISDAVITPENTRENPMRVFVSF